jgi:transposase
MNIQLSLVLTDVTGVPGLAMLRAIVAGERDPARRAPFRQPGCNHSAAAISKARTGPCDDAPLFVRQQAVDLFADATTKIVACASKLAPQYQAMESRGEKDAPLPDRPPANPESRSKHARTLNARAPIARVIGVALVAVMG